MKKQYLTRLTPAERRELEACTRSGTMKVRASKRARTLLKADTRPNCPAVTDIEIAAAVGVSLNTVLNVRKRYLRDGLAVARQGRYTGHNPRLLDGEAEAHLIALTCSEPPKTESIGRCNSWPIRWSNSAMRSISRMKQSARCSKKHAQAVVETGMVHPAEGKCRLRQPDGSSPRPLSGDLR